MIKTVSAHLTVPALWARAEGYHGAVELQKAIEKSAPSAEDGAQ